MVPRSGKTVRIFPHACLLLVHFERKGYILWRIKSRSRKKSKKRLPNPISRKKKRLAKRRPQRSVKHPFSFSLLNRIDIRHSQTAYETPVNVVSTILRAAV